MKVYFGRRQALPNKLGNIRIASPCSVDWEQMRGDDRVRHCLECNLNVYNFSAMTSREVEQLLVDRQGRLCARFYRRSDGTVLTQDCPRGLRAVAHRVFRVAGVMLSVLISAGVVSAQSGSKRSSQPLIQIDQVKAQIGLRVIDPTGAVVPGARVVLMKDTGLVLTKHVTDQEGMLRLTGLSSGSFVIQVSATAFYTHEDTVRVSAGEVLRVEVKLEPAGASVVVGMLGGSQPVNIIPDSNTPEFNLPPIPYTPTPAPQAHFLRRFFAGIFHKFGL